jgi:hypothetical protein
VGCKRDPAGMRRDVKAENRLGAGRSERTHSDRTRGVCKPGADVGPSVRVNHALDKVNVSTYQWKNSLTWVPYNTEFAHHDRWLLLSIARRIQRGRGT